MGASFRELSLDEGHPAAVVGAGVASAVGSGVVGAVVVGSVGAVVVVGADGEVVGSVGAVVVVVGAADAEVVGGADGTSPPVGLVGPAGGSTAVAPAGGDGAVGPGVAAGPCTGPGTGAGACCGGATPGTGVVTATGTGSPERELPDVALAARCASASPIRVVAATPTSSTTARTTPPIRAPKGRRSSRGVRREPCNSTAVAVADRRVCSSSTTLLR